MMQLRGRIEAETTKAILFKVEEDICSHLKGKTIWFPKSKIKLPKRREGTININVPNWLYDEHVTIDEWKQ